MGAMTEMKKAGPLAAAVLSLAALTGCARKLEDLVIPEPPAASENNPAVSEKVAQAPEMWVDNGNGLYMFHFDSKWPETMRVFCQTHPELSVVNVCTASEGGYSHVIKVLVLTREKLTPNPTPSEVYVMDFGSKWPQQYREFLRKHPELNVTATYPAEEGGYSHIKKMMVIAEKVPVQAEAVVK